MQYIANLKYNHTVLRIEPTTEEIVQQTEYKRGFSSQHCVVFTHRAGETSTKVLVVASKQCLCVTPIIKQIK